MKNEESIAEAVAELFQSVLATPNHRRRLKSSSFWDRLGCKRRTPDRIEQVRGLLEHHGLAVSLRQRHSMDELRDVAFGSEGKSDWIVLTDQEAASPPTARQVSQTQAESDATPLDSWFRKMTERTFGSESEVVKYFVCPLFEHLGYEEPDFALEYPVVMNTGVKRVTLHADVVLFKRDERNGDRHTPDNTLILADAKRFMKRIDPAAVAQARSYAVWLLPVYYVLTNGDAIEVYLYKVAVAEDVHVMSFKRADLKIQWSELFRLLCKERVLGIKDTQRRIIAELQKESP